MRNAGAIMRTTVDDLTERVQVVRREKARDRRGAIICTGERVVWTAWAKVLPKGGGIREEFPEREGETAYRIVIRHREGILQDDEILWRGKRLQMVAPPYDAESRREWTVLECKEMASDGEA